MQPGFLVAVRFVLSRMGGCGWEEGRRQEGRSAGSAYFVIGGPMADHVPPGFVAV